MGDANEGTMKCWRCGMILPEHELQLLDNQWHCAYCYMDVKMLQLEEERAREHSSRKHKEQERTEEEAQVPYPHHASGGRQGDKFFEEHRAHKGGWCMKCGRECGELYVFGSRHLCLECFAQESGKEAGGWTVLLKSAVNRVLQVVEKRREKQEARKKAREDFGKAKNDVEGKKKPAK